MKGIIVMLFTCFLVSCNYKRKQNLPKGIVIKTVIKTCDFNIYKVLIKQLSNVEKTDFKDWNEGLICQGYSDILNFQWINYSSVYYEYQPEIKYFSDKVEFCLKKELDKKNIWVAACLSKFNNSEDPTPNFYKIFFLDKKESILYELEILN